MTPPSSRPTWAEIDLDALAGNYLAIQKHTGRSVMGIVKANAYGHGAVAVARALSALGAPVFGVATVDEGAELRGAGLREPILVLGCLLTSEIDALFELGLSPQITDIRFARELSRQASRRGRSMTAHLKVDTGMRRCGVPAQAAMNAAIEVSGLPGLSLGGVMTHFPSSDELDGEDFTRRQIADFQSLTTAMAAAGVKTGWRHAANSGAVLGYPDSWFDMVRPGMILYGCYPSHESPRSIAIRQVMTLKTRVTCVRHVGRGDTIGYGRAYMAPRDMRVGLLPIGYADGFNREFSNLGKALIHERYAPLIGRICMDQCFVDLTDIPQANAGSEVVLYGRQGPHCLLIDELARSISTIPNVLVTSLGQRTPRVYVQGQAAR